MTTTSSVIHYDDPRTGKHYAVQVEPGAPKELILEKLAVQAERDYQKTLPPERRAVANQPTDFTCPHCLTHEKPVSRKQAMTSGWFLGVSTYLKDVFKCSCGREFTDEELSRKREEVSRGNHLAVLMEKYKDGEITEEVVFSATKAFG